MSPLEGGLFFFFLFKLFFYCSERTHEQGMRPKNEKIIYEALLILADGGG